jgi:hypothetical protein
MVQDGDSRVAQTFELALRIEVFAPFNWLGWLTQWLPSLLTALMVLGFTEYFRGQNQKKDENRITIPDLNEPLRRHNFKPDSNLMVIEPESKNRK